jgi:hypothetical protein
MGGAKPLTSPIRLHGVDRVNVTAILTLTLHTYMHTYIHIYSLVNEVINSASLIGYRVTDRAISVK